MKLKIILKPVLMNIIRKILVPIIFVFLIASCNNENTTKQPIVFEGSKLEDTLIKANKYLLKRDKELIESYIQRRNWKMQSTDAGLWYEIYHKTKNKKIVAGDIIKYNYEVSLLDGTLCYSSEKDGFAQVKIGQTGKETGLDRGLLKMRIGEKAHLILPPYMAHGLIGDMDRIPSRSTIVYDIEILELIDF